MDPETSDPESEGPGHSTDYNRKLRIVQVKKNSSNNIILQHFSQWKILKFCRVNPAPDPTLIRNEKEKNLYILIKEIFIL